MKRVQQGFTLIELMIVVAIVGILAAVAIPAYMDYVARSKVSEAMAAMGACKTSVTEYVQVNNKFPAGLAESGCTNLPTEYVSKLDVVDDTITVTIKGVKAGDPDGKTLSLKADANPITKWTCSTTATPKYVPAQCRG